MDSQWDKRLPLSLVSKMEQCNLDSSNSSIDILLENATSGFVDIRRTGWQELARATEAEELARATEDENEVEALLQAIVNDEECISLGARVVREDSAYELTDDTQRCVLRTLLNISMSKDIDARRKIFALVVHVLVRNHSGYQQIRKLFKFY